MTENFEPPFDPELKRLVLGGRRTGKMEALRAEARARAKLGQTVVIVTPDGEERFEPEAEA